MRNLHKVAYTSSYDRGLEHLLTLWPKVRSAVPDAELHIYYGWQLFDKFYSNNPSSMKWKDHMLEMMRYEGVADHGRLPQPLLARELKTCGVWAYPTHFGEINCISALKAQVYGCEPVVVEYAALEETVHFGRKVKGDIYDTETQEAFLKELLDALKNPLSDEKREDMMAWAKSHYSWDKIIDGWSTEFKENV